MNYISNPNVNRDVAPCEENYLLIPLALATGYIFF